MKENPQIIGFLIQKIPFSFILKIQINSKMFLIYFDPNQPYMLLLH